MLYIPPKNIWLYNHIGNTPMAVAEEHEAIGAQSGSTICPGTS